MNSELFYKATGILCTRGMSAKDKGAAICEEYTVSKVDISAKGDGVFVALVVEPRDRVAGIIETEAIILAMNEAALYCKIGGIIAVDAIGVMGRGEYLDVFDMHATAISQNDPAKFGVDQNIADNDILTAASDMHVRHSVLAEESPEVSAIEVLLCTVTAV